MFPAYPDLCLDGDGQDSIDGCCRRHQKSTIKVSHASPPLEVQGLLGLLVNHTDRESHHGGIRITMYVHIYIYIKTQFMYL